MHGLDSAPELKRRWTGLDGMLLQNRLGSPELAVSGLEEPRRKKRFRVWIDNFRSSCMPESGSMVEGGGSAISSTANIRPPSLVAQ